MYYLLRTHIECFSVRNITLDWTSRYGLVHRQLTYRVKETELKKCSVDTIMWAIKTRGHQIRTPFDLLIDYTHTVPCCSTKPKVSIWLLFKASRYCISSLHSSIMYLQSQTVVTVSLKIKHPFHFELQHTRFYLFTCVFMQFMDSSVPRLEKITRLWTFHS